MQVRPMELWADFLGVNPALYLTGCETLAEIDLWLSPVYHHVSELDVLCVYPV